jgi:branched-chain amino acid transport system ATP-binding protein
MVYLRQAQTLEAYAFHEWADAPARLLAPLIVRDIFRTIERLREEGTSILLIEQNARAALEVASHGSVLETGSFSLHGPAQQLSADARVIESYLGSARKT